MRKKKTTEGSESEEESENEDTGSNDASGSEEESESEDDHKKTGAHSLIEIENPNRIQRKAVLKVTSLDTEVGTSSSSAAAPATPAAPVELSRREREEIERQKKQANYQKLHAQGKTEQARADLARLAIIKQQREEAAKMRESKKKETDPKAKK